MFRAYPFTQSLVAILAVTSMALSSVGTLPGDERNDATEAATWYVSPTGLDANSCANADVPCLTINAAVAKAASGDTIDVAVGMYTGTGTDVVLINKDVTLSGGWDAGFTTQSGLSIIDGQHARRCIAITSTSAIDHFRLQNGQTPADRLWGRHL